MKWIVIGYIFLRLAMTWSKVLMNHYDLTVQAAMFQKDLDNWTKAKMFSWRLTGVLLSAGYLLTLWYVATR